MKLCFISDTHRRHSDYDCGQGDILIHSGDADINTFTQLKDFNAWFAKQNYRHKIFVPGNHDSFFENEPDEAIMEMEGNNVYVLINDGVELEGLKFWGSPYTLTFGWWSFMVPEIQMKDIVAKIPMDTNILITHGPPKMILDGRSFAGSDFLAQKVFQVNPIIHAFGHIHEEWGTRQFRETLFINAAVSPWHDEKIHEPWIVELGEDKKILDYYYLGFKDSFREAVKEQKE